MALTVGASAPDFTLYSDGLEAVTLSDKLKGGHVLLLFYPGAFTSVCTTELNSVNNDMSRYETANVQILGISTDSPFVLQEFKKTNGFSFPLLSDHNAEVSALYGTKYDNDFTSMNFDRIAKRAAFLIANDGTIKYAEVLDNAGEQPDFDAIKSVLDSL
ncbi:MAG: redoxin domain-containing protein [Bacteroidota bacterium]